MSLDRPDPVQNRSGGTPEGARSRSQIVEFVAEFSKAQGYPPTLVDIQQELGLSRTAVNWHLDILREQRVLDFRDGARGRTLRVLRRPR